MEIVKTSQNNQLNLALKGRLDTATAPDLETVIREETAGITTLILDFSELAYISSAGLRVLLAAQKIMNRQGKMILRNVNNDIKEVFEITGFIDILTIEEPAL